MVKIKINYKGGLRCDNTHEQSGSQFSTDAPLDNNGKGESFSPTDLLATALGSCMATVMGIVAERKGVDLTGMQVDVGKHMSTSTPRRVAQLDIAVTMPLNSDHSERALLESAAHSCPVLQSLHPDVKVNLVWSWQGN